MHDVLNCYHSGLYACFVVGNPPVGKLGENKGHTKHLISFLTMLCTVAMCIVFSQH